MSSSKRTRAATPNESSQSAPLKNRRVHQAEDDMNEELRRLRAMLIETHQTISDGQAALAKGNMQLLSGNLSPEMAAVITTQMNQTRQDNAKAETLQTVILAEISALTQRTLPAASSASSSTIQIPRQTHSILAAEVKSTNQSSRTPQGHEDDGDGSPKVSTPEKKEPTSADPQGAGEGIGRFVWDNGTLSCVDRLETRKQLLAAANPTLLVHGPFASGKTSLVQLFGRKDMGNHLNVQVVTLLHMPHPDQRRGDWFSRFWYGATCNTVPAGFPFGEQRPQRDPLLSDTRGWTNVADTLAAVDVLVIDEVQVAYGELEQELWTPLKCLAQQMSKTKVILFASCGFYRSGAQGKSRRVPAKAGTPLDLRTRKGLEVLRYTDQEASALFDMFRKDLGVAEDSRAWQRLRLMICTMSGLHPGIIADCMGAVRQHFFPEKARHLSPPFDEDTVSDYLVSWEYFDYLYRKRSRALPYLPAEDSKESSLARRAAVNTLFSSEPLAASDRYGEFLERHGIMVKNVDGTWNYSCPLTRQLLRMEFPRGGENTCKYWITAEFSFAARMKHALMGMDCSLIAKANEDQCALSLYRALLERLPSYVHPSVEVSKLTGIPNGMPDCILVDTQTNCMYGVELLRGGRGIRNHAARFQPGGRYHGDGFAGHLTIDFLIDKPADWSPRGRYANTWRE